MSGSNKDGSPSKDTLDRIKNIAIAVKFKKFSLANEAEAEYSIIQTYDDEYKIVIHFLNMGQEYMDEIDRFFQLDVAPWLIKQPEAFTFGLHQNPEWPDKLDFILAPISKFRAQLLTEEIVTRLQKKFGR